MATPIFLVVLSVLFFGCKFFFNEGNLKKNCRSWRQHLLLSHPPTILLLETRAHYRSYQGQRNTIPPGPHAIFLIPLPVSSAWALDSKKLRHFSVSMKFFSNFPTCVLQQRDLTSWRLQMWKLDWLVRIRAVCCGNVWTNQRTYFEHLNKPCKEKHNNLNKK